MKSIKTNEKAGKSLAALLFNAYLEYGCNFYPKDPAIYVIWAHPTKANKVKSYLKTYVIYKDKNPMVQDNFWGFQLKIDLGLEEGIVIFGPETVEIKWTEI